MEIIKSYIAEQRILLAKISKLEDRISNLEFTNELDIERIESEKTALVDGIEELIIKTKQGFTYNKGAKDGI